MTVEKWIASEIIFESVKKYNNPFEDVDVDVVFTLGKEKMTVPCFWDGGKVWKARFALPKEGLWKYTVKSTDKDNSGFIDEGVVECVKYSGNLEIYKHGFIKTQPNVRYFTYADGTPFFYLGDTHWSMAKEEFDSPGDRAGDIKCDSHFKYIVDLRVEQGFTVYQSEPNGVKYTLIETLTEEDVEGFKELDKYFKYIAEKGLVHANAQLLFPWDFFHMKRWNNEDYLMRLARYWVARYSCYPCLWTLAQEVDNDFYFSRGDHKRFTKEDNPFKILAKGMYKYDPHKHPLTAHMESYATSPEMTGDREGTCPSTSAFREVEGHTWWAYQWSRNLNAPINYAFGEDNWLNGQGKVAVLYESRYEYLYVKNYGARSQGWLAFLNGLYGYGYGAQDIWLYKCNFAMKNDTADGIDVVTVEDKKIHWSETIKFKTPEQLNYMRQFFEKLEWWKLVPRFNSPAYFVSDNENYHAFASDERKTIVIYFCNIGYETGRIMNLDKGKYTYQWFNPRTNEYSEKKTFYPDEHRIYHVEQKPEKEDMVLLVEKV